MLCSIEFTEDGNISLTILESNVEDAGTYTLNITNDEGSIESSVEVTIEYEPPVVRHALADVTVPVDTTATLECHVHGLPGPQTTWFAGGSVLQESNKYHMEHVDDIARLEIRNVTPDDAVTYTCRATSAVGTVETSASLTVQGLLCAPTLLPSNQLLPPFWLVAAVCCCLAVAVAFSVHRHAALFLLLVTVA